MANAKQVRYELGWCQDRVVWHENVAAHLPLLSGRAGVGRSGGVGRALGVAVGLGVGVILGVELGVAVGVGLGVGVGVIVGVGVPPTWQLYSQFPALTTTFPNLRSE